MTDSPKESNGKLRSKNGAGHTYPYRNGWRTVIQFQGRVVTATGATKSESQRRAAAKAKTIRPLNYGKLRSGGTLLVGDYLLDWLNHEHRQSLAFTTYRRYLGLITNHINPLIGHIKLAHLEKRHIKDAFRAMKKLGQSDRSVQQAYAVLSGGLNAAVEEDLISFNPVRGVRKIALKQKQVHPLSTEEVAKVLAATEDSRSELRWRLAMLYGLRQGEALGLRWSDLDTDEGLLRIRFQIQYTAEGRTFTNLKTDMSRRDLYLDERTLQLLTSHRATQEQHRKETRDWVDNNLIFANKQGRPMQARWDSELWHRALARADVPDRRLHDARHTAATILYANNTDIEVIRRFLGHSDISLTSRTYVHSAAQPMKAVAAKLKDF